MEYTVKCNTCGKIYCFTDKDLKEAKQNAALGAISAVGGIASVLGGSWMQTYALNNQTDKYASKVIDYSKCPFCHSSKVHLMSEAEQRQANMEKNPVEQQNESIGEPPAPKKAITVNSGASIDTLMMRAELFLEDGDWESASAYCDNILDMDPTISRVYLLKAMASYRIHTEEELGRRFTEVEDDPLIKKAIRFGDETTQRKIESYNQASVEFENERIRNLPISDREWLERRGNLDGLLTVVSNYICALKPDGTVLAVKRPDSPYDYPDEAYDFASFTSVKSIADCLGCLYGLKDDGTVIRTGPKRENTPDVTGWKNIKTLDSSGIGFLLGVDNNSRVVMSGDASIGGILPAVDASEVRSLTNVEAAFGGVSEVFALKKDNTIQVVTKKPDQHHFTIESWTDIVSFAGPPGYIGLKRDGTVVAAGKNDKGQCDVEEWEDIISVVSFIKGSIGLKADGTLVTSGEIPDVRGWSDIVAISNGDGILLGLRADGHILCAGKGCESLTKDWVLTHCPDYLRQWRERKQKMLNDFKEESLQAEKQVARENLQHDIDEMQKQLSNLKEEKAEIEAEIPALKGIFAGTKKQKYIRRIEVISETIKEITDTIREKESEITTLT